MRNRPLLIFVVVHFFIFFGFFVPLAQVFFPAPGGLERHYTLMILDGLLPYRDFSLEYPPFGLISFLLPGLFFREPFSYSVAYAAEMLAFNIINLFLVKSLAERFHFPVWTTLGLYTLLMLATGPIIVVRYDLFPAMLTLAAVWAFVSGRTRWGWVILGLGIMAKIYPIVLAPVFAIYQFRNRRFQDLAEGVAFLAITILVLALPWMMIAPDGFISMLTYHAERGLQWESTYATILLMGQVFGLTRVTGELSYGSWNAVSPPLAVTFSEASMYVTGAALLALYIMFARRIWRNPQVPGSPEYGERLFVIFSTLAILVFMLANKVFSAQFVIWLVPLLPLITRKLSSPIPYLFVVAAAITQIIFPYFYVSYESGETPFVILMALRNLLLVVLAVVLARRLPGTASEPAGIQRLR